MQLIKYAFMKCFAIDFQKPFISLTNSSIESSGKQIMIHENILKH